MPERKPEQNLFHETLAWICRHLESLDIPYMITGCSAVGFWGHIRTTMDIDMVVEIHPLKIKSLLQEIRQEAYIDIEEIAARKPLKMFNIILHKTGFKIDIIPLNETDDYELVKFGPFYLSPRIAVVIQRLNPAVSDQERSLIPISRAALSLPEVSL